MPLLYRALVAAAIASSTSGLLAHTLKPGLWEINNTVSSNSGVVNQLLSQAPGLIASLPAEQRSKLENLMARQGVTLGASGAVNAKICMTQAMVDRNELPAQTGNCQSSPAPRTGNTLQFSFTCSKPVASGQGQITILSPVSYTVRTTVNSQVQGQATTVNTDGTARFVAASCGEVRALGQ